MEEDYTTDEVLEQFPRMRIWALDATIVDVQRKVVEPYSLNNIWLDVDPM
jgi:hypothetical protein